MAYKLSNETIKDFNERYGVNVSVDKYLAEAKRTSPNDALKSIFSEAYKMAVINELSRNSTDFKSQNMFKDFSEMVIDSLIWELPLNKKPTPDKNAGLSKLDSYKLMEETWNTLPNNTIDAVVENYKNGNIRIRDMVEYAKSLEFANADNDQLNMLASYSEALKKVNESRSFIWKVFHPIRNNAEKRDSKLIENMAKKHTTEIGYNVAVSAAKYELSNVTELKDTTIKNVLGVENVMDYNPENDRELTKEELKSNEIDEWREKYEGKGIEFFQKETVALGYLKENPYENSEENPKIEEPAIENPNLNKNL